MLFTIALCSSFNDFVCSNIQNLHSSNQILYAKQRYQIRLPDV